ncbi:MAG: 30S ribosomal protein S6 [Planctomycetes bacterium]|nr:30S ribosomal protein S6 [Planctomycetota bacterium]
MSDETMNYYEGLFLFPQAMAGRMSEMISHMDELLERAGAKLVAMSKWHEGNLAYTIQKSRRGIYFLTYFEAQPERIAGLERDSNLSESIIRFMFTRADHLTVEEMTATDGRQAIEQESRLKTEGPADKPAAEAPAAPAALLRLQRR